MKPRSTISPLHEAKKWALQTALDGLLWVGVAMAGWNFWGKAFDWVSRSKYHSWSNPIVAWVSSLTWTTEAAPFEGWLPQPRSGERDPFLDP